MEYQLKIIILLFVTILLLNRCNFFFKLRPQPTYFQYKETGGSKSLDKPDGYIKVVLSPNINEIFDLLPDTVNYCFYPMMYLNDRETLKWINQHKKTFSYLRCYSCNGIEDIYTDDKIVKFYNKVMIYQFIDSTGIEHKFMATSYKIQSNNCKNEK